MDTKLCTKCQNTKPIDSFHKKRGRHARYCAECQNQWTRDHYQNNKKYYADRNKAKKTVRRQWLLDLLQDKKCEMCGESRIACLDFDHIDPKDKKFNICQGAIGGNYSIERILEEIKKCRILCANCHRVETSKQFGWYRQ